MGGYKILLLLTLILISVFLGCMSSSPNKVKNIQISAKNAEDLVPPSSDYTTKDITGPGNMVATEAVQIALSSNTVSAPFAVPATKKTDTFLKCLKATGVTKIIMYNSKSDILSVGVYGVGEENAEKILTCLVLASALPFSVMEDNYGLCGSKLTVNTGNDKTFHVVFFGTSEKACDAMCNKEINGCTSEDIKSFYVSK